jgi:poly-gamma-glutamate capsule biosynthesis protein CapA/YwtB (metallophosphatase superfamily)
MTVKLVAAGDFCPGDHYFSLGHGTGARLAAGLDPLREIKTVLSRADLCIANLEGPISAGSSHEHGPEAEVFRGPPATAALLRRAGIDLVHVANNHILQHGTGAFSASIEALREQGLTPIGMATLGSIEPVIKTVNGLRLGFVASSFVTERYIPGQRLYDASPLPVLLERIADLRPRVDIVVVSIHWGIEATALPTREVIAAAHAMVDAGARVVLGHHPHWFQPVERVGPALIAYSLGDFVFDLFWDRRLIESAILRVDLDAGGVVGYELIPIRFERDYQVRTVTGPRAERFLATLDRSARLLEYSVGNTESNDQLPRAEGARKLIYFLSVLHKGHTFLKVRFVIGKLAGAVHAKVRSIRGKAA